jgi:hypothetical protein
MCGLQKMAGHLSPGDHQPFSSVSSQLRLHLEGHADHCWQQYLHRLAGCASHVLNMYDVVLLLCIVQLE